MKLCALVLLLVALAVPVSAANHNEAVDGDLSTDPNVPTPLALTLGSNLLTGTTGNIGGIIDRDYITFNVPNGFALTGLTLLTFTPNNLAFAAFNSGTVSFVPSGATALLFLAGIHPDGSMLGTNLMPVFVNSSVTGNSLPVPLLGPGDYCFLIQQTSPLTQEYSLDFILEGTVGTSETTWGGIKALYR